MFLTLTKRSLYRIAVSVFIAVLFFSCQKELSIENGGVVVTPPDLSTKVKSSVSGFVTDENDAPVLGASVQFGTSSTTTDKYGYFEVRNVQVVQTAAVVSISKAGYFKGIKTYMARENKSAFFRIKLIPKTTAGTINASTGGNVTLSNGLSISLPAGAVVNATTNAAYTGTVNVAAYHINPEAADLDRIMPGDLRGINTDGGLKMLKTFGMAAIELTGTSGELLQIAPGKKATLTIPIPATLSGDATASIPLWYFDESNGLWKEQGSAVKTGNAYVGDVSHFSYWNCDYPITDPVYFDCTVVDATGNPIPGIGVWIYYSNGLITGSHGITDSSGYVGGMIPGNYNLIVKVIDYNCPGAVVFSQNFTTTNLAVHFGNITVNAVSSVAVLTGSLTNCSNQPVTNGYVLLHIGNQYVRQNVVSANGNFSFNQMICGSPNVDIIGGDVVTAQESAIINTTLVSGTNNLGTIQACGTSVAEFFNYTANAVSTSFIPPAGYMYQMPDSFQINSTSVYASAANSFVQVGFSNVGIGSGSSQAMTFFQSTQTNQTTISGTIPVHITEYGSVGQYMAGNFAGTVTGTAPPNTTYAISGNFRVKRNY